MRDIIRVNSIHLNASRCILYAESQSSTYRETYSKLFYSSLYVLYVLFVIECSKICFSLPYLTESLSLFVLAGITVSSPELARDSWGVTKRCMRRFFGATPFIRLPHPSKPPEFAYVIFKTSYKPTDYIIIFEGAQVWFLCNKRTFSIKQTLFQFFLKTRMETMNYLNYRERMIRSSGCTWCKISFLLAASYSASTLLCLF